MASMDSGDFWETTVDDLGVVRWTAVSGGATLVRLRLTNDSDETIVTRIVEDLPTTVSNAVLITTTSDTPDSWRRMGDHVVHEFVIPAGQKRTTAYLIRSDDEPPVSIEEPIVESIRHVPDGGGADVDEYLDVLEDVPAVDDDATTDAFPRWTTTGRLRDTLTTAPVRAGSTGDGDNIEMANQRSKVVIPNDMEEIAEEKPTESTGVTTEIADENGDEPPETRGDRSTGDESSIVDELLVALEEDATPEQQRALRKRLGASESERARLRHVQGRLDDFAAYVDALEELIDEHGTEFVDELREAIEANAAAMATLEEELAETRTELNDRLEVLESRLNATGSELSDLQEDVENDRQARAREIRQFERSISDIEGTLERLEDDVRENDAFRRRFTAAFTSSSVDSDEDDESATPVEYEPASRSD